MKVLSSAKTTVLKNTFSQNVNESFHFILENVENSSLRIELKQKMLNCQGKTVVWFDDPRDQEILDSPADSVLTSLCLGHLEEVAGRAHWEAAVSQHLHTISQSHYMMERPTRSFSYDHLNLQTPAIPDI